MIKKLFALLLLVVGCYSAQAQKAALVDMEYIMGKIPQYTTVSRQLEEQSKRWQGEVTRLESEAQALYKKYQSEASYLSADQKKEREEAVIAKERQAYELKRKYFGPEGELMKRRTELMKPIQDKVWAVLKDMAIRSGLSIVIDRSSGKVVFADPSADISGAVVQAMGYDK